MRRIERMSVRFGIAQPTGRLGQRPRTPKAIAPRGIRYRNQLRSCQTSARARPLKDPAIHAIAVHPETPRMLTDPAEWSDRKSTRLNSSHTVISYAVFCLKK